MRRCLAASLLPGDREETNPQRIAEAARFSLAALSKRKGHQPTIALESIGGGTGERYMRLAVVNDDMPFLVDSVAAAVTDHGLAIDRLLHPVLPVRRDGDGRLLSLADEGQEDGAGRESLIYLETPRADSRLRRRLAEALAIVLGDVRAAVADWPKMREAMRDDAERLADPEGAALLRWLADRRLTHLGHVTLHRDGSSADALGICRKSAKTLLADASYERAFAWFEAPGRGGSPLMVKANVVSHVHRLVPLDLFIVPVMENGTIAALSVHAGLWTSAALATSPEQIPHLRRQLAAIMDKFGFDPAAHAGKSLIHALTALPHDLIIGFMKADLERVATAMMSLVDRPRPQVALVQAPLARHLFAFVWLPRDQLSTQLRLRIQQMLVENVGGPVLDWSLQVEASSVALLRFVIDIRDAPREADEAALDRALKEMLRGWSDAVEAELAQAEDATRAAALAVRYADAFPEGYRREQDPKEAARDILVLRTIDASLSPGRGARLHLPIGDSGTETASTVGLKIYQHEGALALSDAVPVLENFGFRVIGEQATMLDGGRLGSIHDFRLQPPSGFDSEALLARGAAIDAAIAAVLNGAADDDEFNRLMVTLGLEERQVGWLRAWYRYLRQAGLGFTMATVVEALLKAPKVTRGILALFVACHDPAFEGDRDAEAAGAGEAIRAGLTHVAAINDDRLLRNYHALVAAIVRTNAFAPAGAEALAFKFDSARVPGLPRPLPWREIFVYSRRVEGVHLRAGPVARGGLRWSDRRDDFRTEVLGLMKAQVVKNAVIVPTGAKGGFYPKRLPDPVRERDAWLTEGRESYAVFIRSLLSVTDNIVADRVTHPPEVVIHDGEDPYFVVAADKGTATFSDLANTIAESQDFWLGDAFASGGSKGYDHKEMGITARGAWISVQRHFLELGIDVQTDTVTVAGVGDMSGDVFGNGMLLSKAIKLVAAFDHRHIFLDPDPDPETSWNERQRLFELPRSSWADYNTDLISPGGGVFARSLKAIPLSDQVRALLGLDQKSLDPDSLLNAILRAEVGLLWFGGIGTYVKASAETDGQVGDPANDPLRADGEQLRARVIGEGANLAVTQAGRIAFALAGGRINTDFIDNSGGVDSSDKEVNIKIALAPAKRRGALSERERVALLERMTDDVAAMVLEDNRLQALALSIAETRGARATPSFTRLIETLEEAGQLDRRSEGLADAEALARRVAEGQGLTRPELAVLLSSAKLMLQDAIEAGELPDDPGLADEVLQAFPSAMRDQFRSDILNHRLRREIIATRFANRIVNRLGMLQPFELAEEEGTTLSHVATAFAAAEQLFGMSAIWQALDSAAMPENARLLLFERAAAGLRTQIADLVHISFDEARASALVADLQPGIDQLDAETARLLNAEGKAHSKRMLAELVEAGAPEAEAAAVVQLFDMDGAVGLARLARDRKADAIALTRAFTDLGARLRLDWAQMIAARMNPSDPWERLLVAGLARDFQQMRLAFFRRAQGDPGEFVERWVAAQQEPIRLFRGLIGRAQAAAPVTPAMLADIARRADRLLAR